MTTFVDRTGDLLSCEAEALVNTVNCVGVMGKGIALQFKKKYPNMFSQYQKDCRYGLYKPGEPQVFIDHHKKIVNFPTKAHWKNPSQLEWIKDGLRVLPLIISDCFIQSIAIPPLGCGNGGLDWSTVKPLILTTLADIPDCTIYIYNPA